MFYKGKRTAPNVDLLLDRVEGGEYVYDVYSKEEMNIIIDNLTNTLTTLIDNQALRIDALEYVIVSIEEIDALFN